MSVCRFQDLALGKLALTNRKIAIHTKVFPDYKVFASSSRSQEAIEVRDSYSEGWLVKPEDP
jgi:hypothetical protein